MKRFLQISVTISTIALVGITAVAAKNHYEIASDIYESEVKCVSKLIESGVERKNIEILDGTGTCKNLLTGVIQ